MDWIMKFEWNGLLGILLYWVPMLFCAVFYSVRTAEAYMADRAARDKDAEMRAKEVEHAPWTSHYHYHPRETLGNVLGRALVSITPVANIWAALFDLSPKVFSTFFAVIGRIFDQPLVPK